MNQPTLVGNIEIEQENDRVIIAGDPKGLKSFAQLLIWLADINQEIAESIPIGDRAHIHLSPGAHISYGSLETEICRLDAKGTGEFPKGYKAP